MKKTIPPSAEARAWRRKLEAAFKLNDQGAQLLLESMLESFDRMRQAQKILSEEGIVTKDRFGQARQHPATLIERDAKNAMLRCLKQLCLDVEPPHSKPGRPGGR